MASIPKDLHTYTFGPRRPSGETERKHLLADSVAPSESASMIYTSSEFDGDRTPRAHSPAPSQQQQNHESWPPQRDTIADPTTTPQPYKGFPSEAAYLAALNEWAESKMYIHYDVSLKGFYGPTTMQEYASRPKIDVNLGIKEKWRARKARRDSKKADTRGLELERGERRNTIS